MTIPGAVEPIQIAGEPLAAVDIKPLIAKMWQLHLSDRSWMDRIYEYRKGLRGRPEVPEGSGKELNELSKLAVKNVLGLVVESFAQNLSVVGYRNALAQENDPAWAMWQRNRMDARQAEVHRPALTYGLSYVTLVKDDGNVVLRPRSPRQFLAVYADPQMDAWPQYALEIWVTERDARRQRRGRLYDDRFIYELDLGWLPTNDDESSAARRPVTVAAVDGIREHGATFGGVPVCPVVRFVNDRDADDLIMGEVAPLILLQQAINNVNFDRLIVSRFGARPQWVITGWTAAKAEILKASASRIWTFEDDRVKAQSLPAGSVTPYNDVLEEMLQHVAMVAQISPAYVTGKMVNLSAEALAAAEANQQRKLTAKRESFGESWEQVMRLAAEMDGDAETAADAGAEVVWRDTEARTFASIVDGVVKLASVGAPLEDLLDLIPGVTQQKIQGMSRKMRGARVSSLVDRLIAASVDTDAEGSSDGAGDIPVPQPADESVA